MHRQILILLIIALGFPFGICDAASSLSDNDPPLQLFNATEDVIDSVESLELSSGQETFPSDTALPFPRPVERMNAVPEVATSSLVFAEEYFCRPPPRSFW